jgi:integrase
MDTRIVTQNGTEIACGRQAVSADTRGLAHNPATVYLAGLTSEHSRRTMRGALDTIALLVAGDGADAFSFPWPAFRFEHTAAIRSKLAESYKPATANKMLSALRGVLKAAWRLGHTTAEDYLAAVDVKAVKGQTLPRGRSITPGELGALMDDCANDVTPSGARDAAMVALLYTCGLRRAELVSLDLADFDPNASTLRIRGKGNKE